MWSIFIYFLIFLIPGFFTVFIYDFIKRSRTGSCTTIISALMYDMLIVGINLAGLRFIKGILTFKELNVYFNCLSFTTKYILLSLGVGILLAILTYLLSRLLCRCKRCPHHNDDNCNKN